MKTIVIFLMPISCGKILSLSNKWAFALWGEKNYPTLRYKKSLIFLSPYLYIREKEKIYNKMNLSS